MKVYLMLSNAWDITLSWERGQRWWHSPSLCCSCQKNPELNRSRICLCLFKIKRLKTKRTTCVSTNATATSLPEGVSTKNISSHIKMPVVSLSIPPLGNGNYKHGNETRIIDVCERMFSVGNRQIELCTEFELQTMAKSHSVPITQ